MHITCIYESENCFSFPSIPIVVRWGEVRWKVYCIRHEGERGVRRVLRLVYRYVLLLCAIVVYGMVWYYYYCGTAAACITFNINFYTYIFFFCIKTFLSFISYLFIVVVVVDCVALAFANTKNARLTWLQLRNMFWLKTRSFDEVRGICLWYHLQ